MKTSLIICLIIASSQSLFADETVTTTTAKKFEFSGKFTDELMEGYTSYSFYGAELGGMYKVSDSTPISIGMILGYNSYSFGDLGFLKMSGISILPAAKVKLLDDSSVHPTLLGAAGLQVASGSTNLSVLGQNASYSQSTNEFKGIVEAGVDVDVHSNVSVSAGLRAGSSYRTSFWGPSFGALIRM